MLLPENVIMTMIEKEGGDIDHLLSQGKDLGTNLDHPLLLVLKGKYNSLRFTVQSEFTSLVIQQFFLFLSAFALIIPVINIAKEHLSFLSNSVWYKNILSDTSNINLPLVYLRNSFIFIYCDREPKD